METDEVKIIVLNKKQTEQIQSTNEYRFYYSKERAKKEVGLI